MKKLQVETKGSKESIIKNNHQRNRNLLLAVLGVIIIAIYLVLNYLLHFSGLDLMKNLYYLKYLPTLDTHASYGLLFLFGVLTSFHCIAMCGGIAISQTVGKVSRNTESVEIKPKAWLLPSTLYNLGRVISYSAVGAIVGGLGRVVSFNGTFRGLVPIIGGLFMIIMGLNLLGSFPLLRRFNLRMPKFFAKKILKGTSYGPLYVGLLSGLMPCGPLQIVELYALSTGSVVIGAISMFVFAVGTVPLLFTFGAVNSVINKKNSTKILKASAILVVVLGIVMISRGMALSGMSLGLPGMSTMLDSSQNVAKIQGNSQTVTIKITSDNFAPILVQKGIPVKWIIRADADALNDCNNEITIPKLKKDIKLSAGDNLIEFTPLEEGEIPYTCWMGMIKSKITVVDDLGKISERK